LTGAADVIRVGAYRAFYDLIAIALMTGNTRRARERVYEAREYLPQIELQKLVQELESDYHEFAYE
jgi:hypothetical protein